MILVFGGTTEGRKAVEVLEDAGTTYHYSTKTGEQDIALHHGMRTDGAMDGDGMLAFCQEHGIRLIVDAAHPFASLLHETIADVAKTMDIPVVRYERIYPPRDPSLEWIDDYSQVPHDVRSLLATTGVQSIGKLKHLESLGVKVIYRILNRESSIRLAHQQGATDSQLCFYPETAEAEAILMKESGVSGGFQEKTAAAKAKGMRIIVLKRPAMPAGFHIVNGPHGLRRMVEQLLPPFYPLHSGLTTGTCATAAAVAATRRLLLGETPPEVPVVLPDGETIMVAVGYGEDYAYCIKEAGDDPDVTDGVEVRATCLERREEREERRENTSSPNYSKQRKSPSSLLSPLSSLIITGGKGVGTFTLPGFDYPPGEPAINRSPRQMIEENVKALFSLLSPHSSLLSPPSSLLSPLSSLKITISVPHGEEIAQRTFNPRLGIEGGISIIGVSGIVKPFSEEAFLESIRKCMEVAKASGSQRVVINSGAKSERFVRALYPTLPRQAFVEYGNYIGATLKMAAELGFQHVTLGVMLGKAVKLAEGQLDTHSKKGTMNRQFIQQMLDEAQCRVTPHYTLARELWQAIPQERTEDFCRVVLQHCQQHCQPLVPQAALTLLLIDDDGTIHSL